MTTTGTYTAESFIAGDDLSNSQWTFVKQSTTDDTVVIPGAGEDAVGVVVNNPDTGAAAQVVTFGRIKVLVGTGGVTAGNYAATDASGALVTAASGDYILGVVVTSAVEGSYATIQFSASGSTIA